MSEFFTYVGSAFNGFLQVLNLAIGILLSWTILGVPLLFILATYDFMASLIDALLSKED